MVEIADTGSGISDEDLPFIRQELYRGESACDIPGNGLGLTLVNAIVERHNGQVAICSLKTAGHRGDCAIANHIVGRDPPDSIINCSGTMVMPDQAIFCPCRVALPWQFHDPACSFQDENHYLQRMRKRINESWRERIRLFVKIIR